MSRYVSFENFVYFCDRDFTEQEKTLCDVLRSRRDFKRIQLENPTSYTVKFERLEKGLDGNCVFSDRKIQLSRDLLTSTLQEIQFIFLHELSHLLLTNRTHLHDEAFFILMCVIYQRFYFFDLDFIDNLNLYDLQDIEALKNIVFNRFDTCETLLNLNQVKEVIKLFNQHKLSLKDIIAILDEEDLRPFFHIKH